MRIAVLQPDEAQRGHIADVLTEGGHICLPFSDGFVLTHALPAASIDMLVLDWQDSRLGAEMLRTARAVSGAHMPVLFASTDRSEDSQVRALSVGADDYVSLPVSPSVFRARVDALLRRSFPDHYENVILSVGPYRFHMRSQSVTLDGTRVELSATQFRLASLFFANAGRLLSREHIYATVWGRDLQTLTRTIDSHVSRLRMQLEIDGRHGFMLQPVYKRGYRLLDLDDGTGAF